MDDQINQNTPHRYLKPIRIIAYITLVSITSLLVIMALDTTQNRLMEDTQAQSPITERHTDPQDTLSVGKIPSSRAQSNTSEYLAPDKQSNYSNQDDSPGNPDTLFAQLLDILRDPIARQEITLHDVLKTPGFNQLSTTQLQTLADEVMALIESGDINYDRFTRTPADTYPSTIDDNAEKAATVTQEQLEILDRVKAKFGDTGYTATLTADKLLNTPEVKQLPQHLREQLANEVMHMLARGDLEPAVFFGKARDAEGVLGNQPIAPESHQPEYDVLPGSDVQMTHEQLRTYEELRSRLHNPTLLATGSVENLLPHAKLKTLPEYLHQQLIHEIAGMIERGEIILKETNDTE